MSAASPAAQQSSTTSRTAAALAVTPLSQHISNCFNAGAYWICAITVKDTSATDKIDWFGEDQAASSGNTTTIDSMFGPNQIGADHIGGTLSPGQKFSVSIVTSDCFSGFRYFTYIFGGRTSSGTTLAPQASVLQCT